MSPRRASVGRDGRTGARHVSYDPMLSPDATPAARGAAMAGLLCAAVVSLVPAAQAQSKRALNELGHFEPPAYSGPLVRQGEAWPVFESAMQAYGRKQYQQCADLLRRAVTVEPDDAAANVFLASALMMTDEVGEAEDRATVALAAGQTPYQRTARFVLAKASIRQGKLDAAERELTVLAAGADHLALEAAGLLPRVKALAKRK
jgi:predicted Zn-dependent protease